MSTYFKQVIPVLMVNDVTASIRFYLDMLGFSLAFQDSATNPTYAGIIRDQVLFHIQWHDLKGWEYPNDPPNYRILVHEVESVHQEFNQRGVACTPLANTSWGTCEFHVQDPDHNGCQFFTNLA